MLVNCDLLARISRSFAPLDDIDGVWIWDEAPNRVFVMVLTKQPLDCRALARELNLLFHDLLITIDVVSTLPSLPDAAKRVI